MAVKVRARSGHVLTVTDEAAADYWETLGYARVVTPEPAPKAPRPARKTAAKKAAAKSDK